MTTKINTGKGEGCQRIKQKERKGKRWSYICSEQLTFTINFAQTYANLLSVAKAELAGSGSSTVKAREEDAEHEQEYFEEDSSSQTSCLNDDCISVATPSKSKVEEVKARPRKTRDENFSSKYSSLKHHFIWSLLQFLRLTAG